jgi:hypothetical protein
MRSQVPVIALAISHGELDLTLKSDYTRARSSALALRLGSSGCSQQRVSAGDEPLSLFESFITLTPQAGGFAIIEFIAEENTTSQSR